MPAEPLEIILRIRADQAGRDAAKIQAFFKGISQEADKMGKSITLATGKADKGVQTLVRSAIDLQVVLRETSRLAKDFGGALREAARLEGIRKAFKTMASETGTNANEVLANMKRVARGTIAEIELIRMANRAMLAGGEFFAKELPQLLAISRAASIATGQSIAYTFDSITRGIAKATPMLIDNAEVYIKVNFAVMEYARSIGKTPEQLSAMERQMATLNAVLDAGGDFIRKVGSDTEVATDKFDRMDAKVFDVTLSVKTFLEKALGPLAPVIKTVGDLFQTATPIMFSYVLLKQQATIASIAHTGALVKEITAVASLGTAMAGREGAAAIMARGGAQRAAVGAGAGLKMGAALVSPLGAAAAVGGVVAGVVAYEKVVRKLNPELASTGEILDKGTKIVQWWTRKVLDSKDAADEWMRSQMGMQTVAERAIESHAKHAQELEAFIWEVRDASLAYERYAARVWQVRVAAVEGEKWTRMQTRAQFDQTIVVMELTKETERLYEVLKRGAIEQEDVLRAVMETLDDYGLSAEALRQKQLEVNIAMGETTEEAARNREDIELLTRAYAESIINVDELAAYLLALGAGFSAVNEAERVALENDIKIRQAYRGRIETLDDLRRTRVKILILTMQQNRAVLDEEQQHVDQLKQVYDDGALARLRAAEKRDQTLAQLARKHAQRVQDIERNHRRRMQDIQRQYARTVKQAAIERDALAILQARETRDDQRRDAEEGRTDALADAGRDYAEGIRRANEAYEQRLLDLQRALDEEIQRAQEQQAQRLTDMQLAHADELAELQAYYFQIELLAIAHYARMKGIVDTSRRLHGGPSPRPRGQRFGGSGVVTGPATFQVESGVTEAYWFSGQMGGGRTAPVPAAMHPAQQVQLGGSIGVDVTGIGEQVSTKVVPQIAQVIIDALAEAWATA